VLAAVNKSGLGGGFGVAGASSPDLRFWAAQGVLLLNAALTNKRGARGRHVKLWEDSGVVARAVGRLAEQCPRVVFMLWGEPARKLARFVPRTASGTALVLEYGHPLPANASTDFSECPHFAQANQFLKEDAVVWDNSRCVVAAFTDGACTGNGSSRARGGVGAHITIQTTEAAGPPRVTEIGFEMAASPYRLEWSDSSRVRRARVVPAAGALVPPTNVRAEYLAMAAALEKIHNMYVSGVIVVVSDHRNLVMLLDEWLVSARAAGRPYKSAKGKSYENLDLLKICEELLAEVRARGVVSLRACRAAHDIPRPAGGMDEIMWVGNQHADRLATAAIGTERRQN